MKLIFNYLNKNDKYLLNPINCNINGNNDMKIFDTDKLNDIILDYSNSKISPSELIHKLKPYNR